MITATAYKVDFKIDPNKEYEKVGNGLMDLTPGENQKALLSFVKCTYNQPTDEAGVARVTLLNRVTYAGRCRRNPCARFGDIISNLSQI